MADEERYSNRQIEKLLSEQSSDLKEHIDHATRPILEQTTKTNGRLGKAEEDIKDLRIWRGWMTGGMAVIIIILPVVVGLMTWMVIKIVNVDHTISKAIDEAFEANLLVR